MCQDSGVLKAGSAEDIGRCAILTYAVAFVAVEMISGVTVTAITSLVVLTRVFTASVIHGTFVLICSACTHTHTVHFIYSSIS